MYEEEKVALEKVCETLAKKLKKAREMGQGVYEERNKAFEETKSCKGNKRN